MASKSKLRAQVEDELKTRFVCPAVLLQQQERCLTGGHSTAPAGGPPCPLTFSPMPLQLAGVAVE
jgi:hypothetical protein